jgi:hypothetical protein
MVHNAHLEQLPFLSVITGSSNAGYQQAGRSSHRISRSTNLGGSGTVQALLELVQQFFEFFPLLREDKRGKRYRKTIGEMILHEVGEGAAPGLLLIVLL